MTRAEALALIPKVAPKEPILIPTEALEHLTLNDLPERLSMVPVDYVDGQPHTTWEGTLYRLNDAIGAFCSLREDRAQWNNLIGLPYYFDLLRRSIESRERSEEDAEFCNWEDDGACVTLEFKLLNLPHNLAKADEEVLNRLRIFEEPALALSHETGRLGARIAGKASGWEDESPDRLLALVESADDANTKGRALEELSAHLFASIDGFRLIGRLRALTTTEEIDVSLLNGSDDPVLSREEAYVLVECKNWSGRCGRPEFSLLREKMQNRRDRCSLAFLVSWNGFSETLTHEMLRGSRDRLLIVPLTGKELRDGVRLGSFKDVVLRAIHDAIYI